MTTGLYIGRFQPFHLGHLSALKQALKEVNKVIIGIGSSQYGHTKDNPLTGEERLELIHQILKEEKLEKKCEIHLIPDLHDDEKWVQHVRSLVPHFETVFVGNEGLVKKLFEKEGLALIQNVKHEYSISATQIRTAIREKQERKAWVPQVTWNYLQSKIAVFSN